MRRILVALALCVAPCIALSETYVLPVVTARIATDTYSTTTGFRNDSSTDVECVGRYVREDGRVLTSKYVIAAKTHRVEPDTLLEAGAVGSMRLECSGPLAIASRIQSSRDGGLTFAAGHVFGAAPEMTAVTARAGRTVRATGDLLALEPDGERAAFSIAVKDGAGTVVAERAYKLSPRSQQHIGIAALIAQIKQARVDINVRTGRVIVLEESRTKALAALAPEVPLEQRVAAAKRRAPVYEQAAVVEQLLLCPFKAAPFRDPATGLCFMRDRWYDPATGTFVTPDRSGYADSSNLYAFGRNDPVNLSDPTGEAVPALLYFGHVALQTGIDVGIDWTFHAVGDWWAGSDTAFDWHDSLQTNFAINVASAGVAGKLKHFEKLRNPILRMLATNGADYAVDVAATGTADMLLHDQSVTEAYGSSAAVGGVVGRGIGHGFNTIARRRTRDEMRTRILANLEDSRAGRPTEGFSLYSAVDAQSLDPYTPDHWEMITLRRGTLVAGGDPMSDFFTDVPTVLRSGLDQTRLWGSLQVYPQQTFGPRMNVNVYQLRADVRVPAGLTLANTGAGLGGGGQIFLRKARAKHLLRPVGTWHLH